MNRSRSLFLPLLAVLFSPLAANADLIEVDVTSANTIDFVFSGILAGPVPELALDTLYIDLPEIGLPDSIFANPLVGDANVGGATVTGVFSGFFNPPYGGTIQFRFDSLLSLGDTLGGSLSVIFADAGHGLSQSLFDGAGLAVYWGRGSSVPGAFQGYAITPTPASVPEPSTLALLGIGLAGLGLARRRKKACTNN